jgi:hypothetical protein
MSSQQPDRSAHTDHLGAAACGMMVFEDGHDLHPIIRQAALATPSQWIDALVDSISPDGRIALTGLLDGARAVRWHHGDVSGLLAQGSPVALHSVYGVLAVGDELLSVRPA